MSIVKSRCKHRTVSSGILTRIMQSTCTRNNELITMCLLALSHEAQHYKLDDSLIRQVISKAQAKARERKEGKVERALAKASLALCK